MNNQHFQGLDTPSFALPVPIPDCSATILADSKADNKRTEADERYRTWNWQQAAAALEVKEPTLRKIWWAAKLEPAFRYCHTPLRVVTRTTATREIEEFTAFGMEVLHAYKAAKAKGDRAAELFLAEARATYPAPAPNSPTHSIDPLPAIEAAIAIETGNHKTLLPTPELPQSYSLEGLRQTESIEIEDPLAIAARFLEAADYLQNAMQRDIDQREQKLQQTRQAKNTIVAKAQELKLEQRLYRDRANQVAAQTSEETQSLQEALDVLQGLGKPNTAPAAATG